MNGQASTGGLYLESAPAYPYLASADGLFQGDASLLDETQRLRRLGPFARQSTAVQLARLRSFGMNYYVAMTDAMKTRLAALPDASLVKQTPLFSVFRMEGADELAAPAAARPAAFLSSYGSLDFRDVATALYAGEATFDFPLVEWRGDVRRMPPEELARFGFLIVDGRGLDEAERAALTAVAKPVVVLGGRGGGLGASPFVADFQSLGAAQDKHGDAWPTGWPELWSAVTALKETNPDGGTPASLERSDERTMIVRGRGPVVIRFAYFPYWQPASGTDRIYRVAPDLMLVYPGVDSTAVLKYHPDTVARAAQALSCITLLAAILWIARPRLKRRLFR
jgi:hypothetical protein